MDEQRLRQIARECLGLGGGRLTSHQFGQRLARMTAEDAAALLIALHRWCDVTIPGLRNLALALVDLDTVSRHMTDEGWQAILYQIDDAGEEEIAHFLRDALYLNAEAVAHLPEKGHPTLGFRRWQARQIPRGRIANLLEETHPAVIQNLLDHPQLTERDVVHIATRLENPSAIQCLIARHERWSSRYEVQRALVSNPATPARISLLLMPLLRREDLTEVSNDPNLPDACTRRARHLADLRRHGAKERSVHVIPDGET